MKNTQASPSEPLVPEAENGQINLSRPFTLRLPAFELDLNYKWVHFMLFAPETGLGQSPRQAIMHREFISGAVHEQTFNNTELVVPFRPGDRVEFVAYLKVENYMRWTQIPAPLTYICVENPS